MNLAECKSPAQLPAQRGARVNGRQTPHMARCPKGAEVSEAVMAVISTRGHVDTPDSESSVTATCVACPRCRSLTRETGNGNSSSVRTCPMSPFVTKRAVEPGRHGSCVRGARRSLQNTAVGSQEGQRGRGERTPHPREPSTATLPSLTGHPWQRGLASAVLGWGAPPPPHPMPMGPQTTLQNAGVQSSWGEPSAYLHQDPCRRSWGLSGSPHHPRTLTPVELTAPERVQPKPRATAALLTRADPAPAPGAAPQEGRPPAPHSAPRFCRTGARAPHLRLPLEPTPARHPSSSLRPQPSDPKVRACTRRAAKRPALPTASSSEDTFPPTRTSSGDHHPPRAPHPHPSCSSGAMAGDVARTAPVK